MGTIIFLFMFAKRQVSNKDTNKVKPISPQEGIPELVKGVTKSYQRNNMYGYYPTHPGQHYQVPPHPHPVNAPIPIQAYQSMPCPAPMMHAIPTGVYPQVSMAPPPVYHQAMPTQDIAQIQLQQAQLAQSQAQLMQQQTLLARANPGSASMILPVAGGHLVTNQRPPASTMTAAQLTPKVEVNNTTGQQGQQTQIEKPDLTGVKFTPGTENVPRMIENALTLYDQPYVERLPTVNMLDESRRPDGTKVQMFEMSVPQPNLTEKYRIVHQAPLLERVGPGIQQQQGAPRQQQQGPPRGRGGPPPRKGFGPAKGA